MKTFTVSYIDNKGQRDFKQVKAENSIVAGRIVSTLLHVTVLSVE